MKHLTNICANCGRPKDEHGMGMACEFAFGEWDKYFYDSGQKALDEHSAELFEAVSEYVEAKKEEKENRGNTNGRLVGVKIKDAYQKLESTINKIKPQ